MQSSYPLFVIVETAIYPPVFSQTVKRLLQKGSFALVWLSPKRNLCITAFCLVYALPGLALRLPDVHLQTTLLTGPGWRLENSHFTLSAQALSLRAERAQLSQPALALEQIQLQCQPAVVEIRWRCEQAEFSALMAGRPMQGRVTIDYQPSSGDLMLDITLLHWSKNQARVSFQSTGPSWNVKIDAKSLALAELMHLMSAKTLVSANSLTGKLAGSVQLKGTANHLEHAQWRLRPSLFSFSSEDGLYAGEQLSGELTGQWHSGGRVQGNLELQTGQLLLTPLFWDFDQLQTISLHLSGALKGKQNWQLDKVLFDHPEVAKVSARGRLVLDAENLLQELQIEVADASLEALSAHYLKPLLAETSLAEFAASGRMSATLILSQSRVQQLELALRDATIALPDERWLVRGLNSNLTLTQAGASAESRINWRDGKVYRLSFGAGSLVFSSNAGTLRLQQAARIPLLDGALHIEQLQGQDIFGASPSWHFSGRLQPISMPALSAALEWPALTGQLGGVIPDATYQADELKVAGTLQVNAFDGTISINDLRLANLLGANPEVFANVSIDRLDLETLTRVFDFGKIEGKLNGWVRGLHLQSWQPVAFDARFFSPDSDQRRRRISQRAVESISSLGGGDATAALSRGFLGLFEEFRYKRLGIGCKLERGICQMVGIAPAAGAQGGYYLVEGSGLPRIDVIAYNRLVDWRDLLARLQAAAQSEGPVVR